MKRILLVGHSLGAIKAVYSESHEPNPSVVGLIAASPPRLSCQAFKNSLESAPFFDSLSTAEQLVKGGRGDDLFLAKFPLVTADLFRGCIRIEVRNNRYPISQSEQALHLLQRGLEVFVFVGVEIRVPEQS